MVSKAASSTQGPMSKALSHREAEAFRKAKVEQQVVRVHATMKRVKTSQSIKDLVEFVNSNIKNDKLIYPDKVNPFKPRRFCTIL